MARKQRNNVDYFPHAVTHGKKMHFIRTKFKNDGYTAWFMLLEKLGEASYHYLDLTDEVEQIYLSSELMIEQEKLIEIIETLVKLGEFDAQLWNERKILFNQKFVDNIDDAYKKRSNNCINKEELITLLDDNGGNKEEETTNREEHSPVNDEKVSGNTQRIVKKRIVKKRIGEDTISPTILSDHDLVIGAYNNSCGKVGQIFRLTEKRKNQINLLLKDFTPEEISDVFEEVKRSKFLNGENDKKWSAGIDWVIEYDNFVKIYEGNYTNSKQTNGRLSDSQVSFLLADKSF